jgi:hypothetical protein
MLTRIDAAPIVRGFVGPVFASGIGARVNVSLLVLKRIVIVMFRTSEDAGDASSHSKQLRDTHCGLTSV